MFPSSDIFRHFFCSLPLFLACILLESCNNLEDEEVTWQQFCCRDTGDPSQRLPLYRAKVPTHWVREDILESVQDSRKPICTYLIGESDDSVQVFIHTFTVDTFAERIPPQAQLVRWKRQFDELDPLEVFIDQQAHGGFTGLSLQAFGMIKEKESGMLGYSMQIAPQHWMALQETPDSFKQKQMTADYTLKAVGSKKSIKKWQEEIGLFADSFELIDEVPIR